MVINAGRTLCNWLATTHLQLAQLQVNRKWLLLRLKTPPHTMQLACNSIGLYHVHDHAHVPHATGGFDRILTTEGVFAPTPRIQLDFAAEVIRSKSSLGISLGEWSTVIS
jgi:hypothetical protein